MSRRFGIADPAPVFEASVSALARYRLRTALSVLGIVIGIAAVVAMMSVSEGARREAERLIAAEVRLAVEEDMAECVVLGCAGMAEMRARLAEAFGIPVIDGIGCAVGFVETLVAAGLSTSKAGGYASPFVAEMA